MPFNRRDPPNEISRVGAVGTGYGTDSHGAGRHEARRQTGTGRPRIPVPANATDCHHHIFDHHYPTAPGAEQFPDATIEDYRALQKRLGVTRHVIIQTSTYGTDNSLLLHALSAFGTEARGVAMVNTSVTDGELQRMADAGVRGIRLVLVRQSATDDRMLVPLAQRMNALGWHIDLHISAAQIVRLADVLVSLPCPVVFDHLGRVPGPAGVQHSAFAIIGAILDNGRNWMKLSGIYQDSVVGPPTYSDASKLAAAYATGWPDRVIWGTDWPHPSTHRQSIDEPDDALLLDALAEQVPDAAARRRILVDNPAALFGFPKV
jgi:predicted TIM-barrel fold metal-dependent hydrolase